MVYIYKSVNLYIIKPNATGEFVSLRTPSTILPTTPFAHSPMRDIHCTVEKFFGCAHSPCQWKSILIITSFVALQTLLCVCFITVIYQISILRIPVHIINLLTKEKKLLIYKKQNKYTYVYKHKYKIIN